MKSLALASLLLAAAPAAQVQGGPPTNQLPFEARVLTTSGQPLNGTGVQFTFRLYSKATLGTPLYEQVQQLDVIGGNVSALIGQPKDLPLLAVLESNPLLYLGVQIESDAEMLPRLRLGAAPYAVRALTADSALDVADVDITPSSVSVGGQLVIDSSGNWVGPGGGPGGGVGPTRPQGPIGPTGPAGPPGADGAFDLPFSATTSTGVFGPAFEIVDTSGDAMIGRGGAGIDGVIGSRYAGVFAKTDETGLLASPAARFESTGDADALYAFTSLNSSTGHAARFSHSASGNESATVKMSAGGGGALEMDGHWSAPALWVSQSTPQTDWASYFVGRVGIGVNDIPLGEEFSAIAFLPDEGDSAPLMLMHEPGGFGLPAQRVRLDANWQGQGPKLELFNTDNQLAVRLEAAEAVGNGSELELRNWAGVATIVLDSEYGTSGKGRVTCDVVEIKGGSDIVERFQSAGDAPEPGTVVCIDPENPHGVTAATAAYDRRVLGVVSGAGGVDPGLSLSQSGVLDGDTQVAMAGRVYVRCTAANGAIAPGDLLTSSDLAGHAMLADDPARAFGAVIGKALSGLDEGTGLVLVVVNLQ